MKRFTVFLFSFLISFGVMAQTSNLYDLTDTWNDGATTFDAIKMVVTDTASLADSSLINLSVVAGGTFAVLKNGDFSGTLLNSNLSSDNYMYGQNAGAALTSGVQNVFIGSDAGIAVTTGFRNIFIGKEAGKGTTDSDLNIAIGYFALSNTNTSGNNVAVGNQALQALISGRENVAIGNSIGLSITGGKENVLIGYRANALGGSNVDSAVGIGFEAGYRAAGDDWVGVGYHALYNATGSDNTAIGNSSGLGTTTGASNVYIGDNAGSTITSGSYNIAIGGRATPAVIADSYQIAIGTLRGYPIFGYMTGLLDEDISGKDLTISGPSATPTATVNQDGGNLVLQAGQKATAGGVNGLTLTNDTVYGIMSVQNNVTAEATTDATPRRLAAFDTDGLAHGVTVDTTTNNILTADVAGIYKVMTQISFSGTANSTYHIALYKNTVSTGFDMHRKLGGGGDTGSASAMGLVSLAVGDTMSAYHWSSDGGTSLTVADAQFLMTRISN